MELSNKSQFEKMQFKIVFLSKQVRQFILKLVIKFQANINNHRTRTSQLKVSATTRMLMNLQICPRHKWEVQIMNKLQTQYNLINLLSQANQVQIQNAQKVFFRTQHLQLKRANF